MKKIYIGIAVAVALVVGSLIFFKFKDTSLDKTIEKVKAYDKYVLTCNMEMVENDELKSYLVNVSYFKEKKDEYYKVELYDKSLNQSQIIVKNTEGVFVLTPTLNQVFKFQSDWPENSPKPYIYSYLIQLLDDNKVKKIEKGYQIEAKVSYPNDPRIVKQQVIFDKKLKPLIVLCLDKDEGEVISVKVNEFKTNVKFDQKHFNQNQALKESKNNNRVSSQLDVLYPVALLGSKLESETVSTIEGDKNHILKFIGDKNFTMVESLVGDQMIQIEKEEIVDLVDGFAYYQPGKLTMIHQGVLCSLYSRDLTKEEMVSVMTSIQSSSTK